VETPLYFLSGPTASGKTDLAHRLADRNGLRLISADSMMVYRGMDIGTAKPGKEDIARYGYGGLDLTDPGGRFTAGDWLRAVKAQLDGRPTLVVGGTGLYYRALIQGLAEEDGLPGIENTMTVAELQEEIRKLDPAALAQLADPENPRRLSRALAWLRAGKPLPGGEAANAADPLIPVLQWPVPVLDARIRLRAEQMFAQGLLEEAAALRASPGAELGTAAQAIGYREAFAVLDGTISIPQAVEAVTLRTRQYAKRQRTWFRNQMKAVWIEGALKNSVEFVEKVWREEGPFCIKSFNDE